MLKACESKYTSCSHLPQEITFGAGRDTEEIPERKRLGMEIQNKGFRKLLSIGPAEGHTHAQGWTHAQKKPKETLSFHS